MALDEEYYRKLNESEQRFYGIINEIRIQMGMPTVEVPFYGPKESDATVESNGGVTGFSHCGSVDIQSKNDTPVHLHFEASDSQPKTIEENLKTMKMLAQRIQQFDFSTQPSSAESFICDAESAESFKCDEEQHFQETSGSIDFELFPSLSSRVVEIVDSEPTSFPSEILELQKLVVEESVQGADDDQTTEELKKASVESEVSGSTIEEDPKDFKVIFHPVIAFEFGPRDVSKGVDISIASSETKVACQMFEEMPGRKSGLSKSWVVINEQWVAIMYSIDFVGFPYAHKVLEKMPRNDVALVGSSFHYSLRSIDSPSSFVFDPGKKIEFEVQWMSVEFRSAVEMDELGYRKELLFFVFDPGITEWVY